MTGIRAAIAASALVALFAVSIIGLGSLVGPGNNRVLGAVLLPCGLAGLVMLFRWARRHNTMLTAREKPPPLRASVLALVLLGFLVYTIVVWSYARDLAPLILGASLGLFVQAARWVRIRYPDIER